MSTLDPKQKVERSKWLVPGYSLSNILKSEEHISHNIATLLDWMDRYAAQRKPMNLCEYLTYTTLDNTGEVIFSQPFGFIKEGRDIGNAIKNNLTLNPLVAAAGFFIWAYVALVANPIITWTGLLPMGHLFNTTASAMKKRKENPDARFDIAAHWFKTQKENPGKLSDRDIEAAATMGVGAGGDTTSCAFIVRPWNGKGTQQSWGIFFLFSFVIFWLTKMLYRRDSNVCLPHDTQPCIVGSSSC